MNLLRAFEKLDRLSKKSKVERKNLSSSLYIDEESFSQEKSLTESTYTYRGPVYRFGRLYAEEVVLSTTAPSEGRALANICFRLQKKFNLVPETNLELDPSYLYIDEQKVSNTSSDNLSTNINRPRCKVCNFLLNDAGECPVCDLGETDLL